MNEAAKVCNYMWTAARAHMSSSKAPNYLMAEAVSYSMHVDRRVATTANRGWKAPYEVITGVKSGILKLQRWYANLFVNVPVSKRNALQQKGILDRAEPGRLIGYHSPFSNVYKVMLSDN